MPEFLPQGGNDVAQGEIGTASGDHHEGIWCREALKGAGNSAQNGIGAMKPEQLLIVGGGPESLANS